MGGDGGDDINDLTPAMTRLIIENILRDIFFLCLLYLANLEI